MKWANIKNIILGFLICVNVLFLAYISITTWQQRTIPEKVILASVKLIENEGFECSEDIFPSKYHDLPSLETTFYSASDLSELFFGKQVPFRTVGDTLVAKQEGKTLTVSSNHFIYESGCKPDSGSSLAKTKKALKELGINMNGAVYDEKDGYFYRMYKNTNLFDMYIDAKLGEDGKLCFVSAQWPKETASKGNIRISFIEHIMDLKPAFPAGGEIKNIELGYSLSLTGGDKYIFEPAWRINVNDELKILK